MLREHAGAVDDAVVGEDEVRELPVEVAPAPARSPTRWRRAPRPTSTPCARRRRARTYRKMITTNSTTPTPIWRAKNHQWGFMSRTIVSPSFINRRGYGMRGIVRRFPDRNSGSDVVLQDRSDVRASGSSGVEILGDQEAARPFGERIPIDELVVRRAVVRDDEVRELVDQDVVEHPRREGGQPRGHAYAPGPPACTIPNATAAGPTSARPGAVAAGTRGPAAGRGPRRRCATDRPGAASDRRARGRSRPPRRATSTVGTTPAADRRRARPPRACAAGCRAPARSPYPSHASAAERPRVRSAASALRRSQFYVYRLGATAKDSCALRNVDETRAERVTPSRARRGGRRRSRSDGRIRAPT